MIATGTPYAARTSASVLATRAGKRRTSRPVTTIGNSVLRAIASTYWPLLVCNRVAYHSPSLVGLVFASAMGAAPRRLRSFVVQRIVITVGDYDDAAPSCTSRGWLAVLPCLTMTRAFRLNGYARSTG